MSRLFLFLCFGIAIVLLLTLKLTVRLPPRSDKASVRQLRKKLKPALNVTFNDVGKITKILVNSTIILQN